MFIKILSFIVTVISFALIYFGWVAGFDIAQNIIYIGFVISVVFHWYCYNNEGLKEKYILKGDTLNAEWFVFKNVLYVLTFIAVASIVLILLAIGNGMLMYHLYFVDKQSW